MPKIEYDTTIKTDSFLETPNSLKDYGVRTIEGGQLDSGFINGVTYLKECTDDLSVGQGVSVNSDGDISPTLPQNPTTVTPPKDLTNSYVKYGNGYIFLDRAYNGNGVYFGEIINSTWVYTFLGNVTYKGYYIYGELKRVGNDFYYIAGSGASADDGKMLAVKFTYDGTTFTPRYHTIKDYGGSYRSTTTYIEVIKETGNVKIAVASQWEAVSRCDTYVVEDTGTAFTFGAKSSYLTSYGYYKPVRVSDTEYYLVSQYKVGALNDLALYLFTNTTGTTVSQTAFSQFVNTTSSSVKTNYIHLLSSTKLIVFGEYGTISFEKTGSTFTELDKVQRTSRLGIYQNHNLDPIINVNGNVITVEFIVYNPALANSYWEYKLEYNTATDDIVSETFNILKTSVSYSQYMGVLTEEKVLIPNSDSVTYSNSDYILGFTKLITGFNKVAVSNGEKALMVFKGIVEVSENSVLDGTTTKNVKAGEYYYYEVNNTYGTVLKICAYNSDNIVGFGVGDNLIVLT